MSADARIEVQAGIVAALNADAALAAIGDPALAGRVYNRPPDAAVHPFVTVRPLQMEPWDTDGGFGAEIEMQIDTWSQARPGDLEAHRIAARIHTLLHDATVTLETQALVNIRLVLSVVRPDQDQHTTRIIQRFRVVTQS